MSVGGVMRVLVVDDSAVIRSRLVPLLRDIQGVTEVSEAAGCAAAREAVGRNEPDLIIMDIQMPDGNGIDLLCALRQQGVSSSVIVFTNCAFTRNSFAARRFSTTC